MGKEELMCMQSTVADLEYDQKKKTTHCKRLLAPMNALIPWDELEAEIAPVYRAAALVGHLTPCR